MSRGGRKGSKSNLDGSTFIGDCLLPLLQRPHSGFKRPQYSGPVTSKIRHIIISTVKGNYRTTSTKKNQLVNSSVYQTPSGI